MRHRVDVRKGFSRPPPPRFFSARVSSYIDEVGNVQACKTSVCNVPFCASHDGLWTKRIVVVCNVLQQLLLMACGSYITSPCSSIKHKSYTPSITILATYNVAGGFRWPHMPLSKNKYCLPCLDSGTALICLDSGATEAAFKQVSWGRGRLFVLYLFGIRIGVPDACLPQFCMHFCTEPNRTGIV